MKAATLRIRFRSYSPTVLPSGSGYQCQESNSAIFGPDVVGWKILARSHFELEQNDDYSLAIIFAAMALDCYISWLYLKWTRIGLLLCNVEPDKNEIARQIRSLTRVSDRIKKTTKLMMPKGRDWFVETQPRLHGLATSIAHYDGSVSKALEHSLFHPRNVILHAGDCKSSRENAESSIRAATIGLSIFREMDHLKAKQNESANKGRAK